MFRKTTLIMTLVVFALLSAFSVPVSQGQSQNKFAGLWYMTLQIVGPGLPPFLLGVDAKESQGVATLGNGQPGPFPNQNFGSGTVVWRCTSGISGRALGLSWRHTPKSGGEPTGVNLSFEMPSAADPYSFVLRGTFVTADRIEGKGYVIGDSTDPAGIGYDPQIGYDVNPVTFVMERAQSICVDPTP